MLIQKSFYFVRHGETEHNAAGIAAGGMTDTPLNNKGIHQASLLRDKLMDKKFGRIFSSPMKRAHETAFLATGQKPHVSVDLREWEFGDLERSSIESFLKHSNNLPFQECLPNGESKEIFFNRSIKALNSILKEHENPLVVAHGGTYWAIAHTIGVPNNDIENSECIYFEYERSWKISRMDDQGKWIR